MKESRKMTVGELVSVLKEYPSDSLIRIDIYGELSQFLEIKDVSAIIDTDTIKAHPVLHIDKIEIVEN